MKDIDCVALAEALDISTVEARSIARRVHVTQMCANRGWHGASPIHRFERCPECPTIAHD